MQMRIIISIIALMVILDCSMSGCSHCWTSHPPKMDDFSLREVYYLLGFVVIILSGFLIGRIRNPVLKQWVSSLVGLGGILGSCGWWGSIHILICVLSNLIIILCGNKRYCHVTSMAVTFFHFLMFNCPDILGIPYSPPYTSGVFGMMVFKFTDLAKDVQDAHYPPATDSTEVKESRKIYTNASLSDILHFSLCAVGLIQFIPYRIYHDWIHYPLYPYADNYLTLKRKVLLNGVLGLCVLPLALFYPAEYVRTDDFYEESLKFRLLYSAVSGTIARIFVYMCMITIDIQCILAGMGVYPERTKPKSGFGPTVNFSLVEQIANDPTLAEGEKFNFEATRNVDVLKTEFATSSREAWRNYNNKVQYWYGLNIHKRIPYKSLKFVLTFITWALLHGAYGGHFVFALFMGTSVYIEDRLIHISGMKQATGTRAMLWGMFFWTIRLFGETYVLGVMSGLLLTWSMSYRFLASFYFLPIVYPFFIFVLGLTFEQVVEKKLRSE